MYLDCSNFMHCSIYMDGINQLLKRSGYFATPFRLIPNYLNFDNFKEVLFGKYNYLLMILNSVKVTAFSVILAITTSILAGYGFAKLKFPEEIKFSYCIWLL